MTKMPSLKKAARRFKGFFKDSNVLPLGKNFNVNCKEGNVIGRGSLSVVWKGIDTRNNNFVAVKQMPSIPEITNFCKRELTFLRECKHQNIIVQLIDFIQKDGSFFFILEHCATGNLDDFVKDSDIELHTCLSYMMDVTAGVAFVHGRGISHCSVKPTNVLVGTDRCLKLADLGLIAEITESTFLESSSSNSEACLSWISPEMYVAIRAKKCRKYDQAVDIFCVGLLFHSLLMHQKGQPLEPYEGMPFTSNILAYKYNTYISVV